MGLDLSCGVSFSYGGFAQFRRELAKEIDVKLDEMEGFGGEKSFEKIEDAIKYFLDHSDCDGELEPKYCKLIAPRMKEIADKWIKSNDEDLEYYGEKALAIYEGMIECCENNESLLFE